MQFVKFTQAAILLFVGSAALPLSGAQTYTVLYTFQGGTDGALPFGGLIRDSAGNLYGTTAGFMAGTTMGSVFRLSPSGKFKVLYNFGTGSTGGAASYAALVRDANDNLYGTTALGGSSNQGTIFKLDNSGTFTVLHNFSGYKDGSGPAAPMILDPLAIYMG